ncbi:MAG: MlaD family protein, partial [Gammaproteobacteria bacterium]
MSKPVNTTLLGAFVTGAIVLIAFAIIAFGGEGLFTKSERVIMYFSGNVDGLNVGAPVNVRGVRIGTVREIDIEFNTETGELRVPVIAEIETDSIETVRMLQADDPLDTIIQELGLRAQLQIQSILTSQLFVQLDYHPNTEINYHGDGSLLEIPTIPMMFEQLDRALEDVS